MVARQQETIETHGGHGAEQGRRSRVKLKSCASGSLLSGGVRLLYSFCARVFLFVCLFCLVCCCVLPPELQQTKVLIN